MTSEWRYLHPVVLEIFTQFFILAKQIFLLLLVLLAQALVFHYTLFDDFLPLFSFHSTFKKNTFDEQFDRNIIELLSEPVQFAFVRVLLVQVFKFATDLSLNHFGRLADLRIVLFFK